MSYVEASTAARSPGESLALSGLVSALDELPAESFSIFLPSCPWCEKEHPGLETEKPNLERLCCIICYLFIAQMAREHSVPGACLHTQRSQQSPFSWLKKTLGCLKESKWFLTRHPLSPHTTQTSQGTHYYWKGRNSLSNLGQNNGCKMDSLRTHWAAWTNKSSQQGVAPFVQSLGIHVAIVFQMGFS